MTKSSKEQAMQKISEVMNSIEQSKMTHGQMDSEKTWQPSQADKQILRELFKEVAAIFPKWKELYPTTDELNAAKRVWVKTLFELDVNNPEMIKRGLRACRASGWARPPSAGQFCKWAWEQAERDAMIPDEQEAIRLVVEKAKGDKRVYSGARYHLMSIVSQYLPCANIYGATADQLTNAAIKARLETVEHWKAGKPFNKHNPAQIEKKKPEPVSEEMKNAKWGEIKGIFGSVA